MVSRRIADLSEIASKLVPWFQKNMPQAQNISVSDLRPPQGGFSTETFLFDLSWQEAGQKRSQGMLVRRPPHLPVFHDYDLRRQFLVMKRLQGTNIPVPRVHWLVEQDESVLGTPFYVMDRIDGWISPSDYPPYHTYGAYFDTSPEIRSKMWWGCLDYVIQIHKLDWRNLNLSFLGAPKGGTSTLDGVLDYNESLLNWVKGGEPQPILEAALKWLRENHYVPERITLCWGDCRMPNCLYTPDGDVMAVLDWELAYLGDPVSDLAWFLFLDWHQSDAFGLPKLEGTPGKEETVRRYEELTGWQVKNLFYNEVLAPFRAGIPILKVFKNLKQMGIDIMAEDIELNNPCTQRIASLLNLPAPGLKKEVIRIEDVKVTIQFHLTGPGGRDWYLISDHGKTTTHEGKAESPEITLTASVEDWEAIQSGELGRTDAALGGKLVIDGDVQLLQQLDALVFKPRG